MSNGHVCCLYGVCCPPDRMAAQLVGHFGMSERMAWNVVNEFAILVPSVLPAAKVPVSDVDRLTSEEKLRSLHRRVRRELAGILSTFGHDVTTVA